MFGPGTIAPAANDMDVDTPANLENSAAPGQAAASPAPEADDYPVLAFLPGAPPSKEPGIANLIVSFLDHKDAARASTISKGFLQALRYTTTVRLDPKQKDIPHALEKYLWDEKNQLTPNRRVTELDIKNYPLSNEDLAFIAKYFPALKVLQFYDYERKLTDLSPLKHLVRLQYLKMTGCQRLTDIMPLQNLVRLQHLKMEGCQGLTNITPLQNLVRLQHLEMTGCRGLTDLTPLQYLVRLQHFNMAMTRNKNLIDLTPLQNLVSLRQLDISGCTGLTDLTPLRSLVRLKSLNINNTGFTDLNVELQRP